MEVITMLDQMTYLFRLQAIIETGSLRQAAERLNITQPALSRSVAQLEQHFGQPLLVRHSRGVVPTEFGLRVVSSVHRLARHWEIAEAELAKPGTLERRRLVIMAGPLWRAVVLPAIIAHLHRRFPDLVVELHNASLESAMQDLLEGRCDVFMGGLDRFSQPYPRLVTRHFTTVRDKVVAREDHPVFSEAGENGEIDPERLLAYPWLIYMVDPAYEMETVHATVERTGSAPAVRVKCESLIAAIRLLQTGDYLCILPDAALANTSGPRIVPLPVGLGRRQVPTGAIFREENSDWPPLMYLLELCESGANASPVPFQR